MREYDLKRREILEDLQYETRIWGDKICPICGGKVYSFNQKYSNYLYKYACKKCATEYDVIEIKKDSFTMFSSFGIKISMKNFYVGWDWKSNVRVGKYQYKGDKNSRKVKELVEKIKMMTCMFIGV